MENWKHVEPRKVRVREWQGERQRVRGKCAGGKREIEAHPPSSLIREVLEQLNGGTTSQADPENWIHRAVRRDREVRERNGSLARGVQPAARIGRQVLRISRVSNRHWRARGHVPKCSKSYSAPERELVD